MFAEGIMQTRPCQNTMMNPHAIQWRQHCPHPAKHREIFLGYMGRLLSQTHFSKPGTCTIYWFHEHRWDSSIRRYRYIYTHTLLYIYLHIPGQEVYKNRWLTQARNSPLLLNHYLFNRSFHLPKAAQLPSSCPDSTLPFGSPVHISDPTELLNTI